MNGDRRSDPETEDCRRHEESDNTQAHEHVLADDPPRVAAEAYRKRQMRQVIGQSQDDVEIVGIDPGGDPK